MIDPMTTRHALLPTSLGDLTAVVDEASGGGGAVLVGLYFPGHWTLPDGADHGPQVELGDEPLLAALADELREYLAGERTDFDVAYELRGGTHHRQVWALLERIPYGQTATYGDLARETGGAAQAVGRAVGANPKAARTAGISVSAGYVVVMLLSGGLAGLAGAEVKFLPNPRKEADENELIVPEIERASCRERV